MAESGVKMVFETCRKYAKTKDSTKISLHGLRRPTRIDNFCKSASQGIIHMICAMICAL